MESIPFERANANIILSIETNFGAKESPYVRLKHNGHIFSSDVLSLTTACKMDLYRFPFDTQSCNITLQSTVYSNHHLVIKPLRDSDQATLENKELIQTQGEWELLSINISEAETTILRISMDQQIYQITIKRRPLLYFFNIILPVFFFLVLDVISFFTDSRGADKLSFKITLLLSISVMLLILNDTLPSTSDKIPLIGIYCSGIFCLIAISVMETVFVNFLMAKGAETRPAVDTTAAVGGQDDSERDLRRPPDSVQNEMQKSFCWTRVARIVDVAFLVLYLITITLFMSVLGKRWIPEMF
ncbi:5-hydroxytryptamine receptor 3A-like [Pseudorasbora parva]|uniref:5-hydroxytryptamine receptor 3A-like n=1 Tax=Pseudorasbora parva TaxID=51549 RepID=UPI00351DFB9B